MSDFDRDGLISQVIAVIGAQQFNRFLATLPATKNLGRLRFWQEALVDRVLANLDANARDYVASFGPYEAFVALFEGEERRTYLVSKTEFVANPIAHYDDPQCKYDEAWISDVLVNTEFREHLYELVAVSLLLGDIVGEPAEAQILRDHLPPSRWVECYDFVEQDLETPDNAFRRNFELMFPMAEPYLSS